MSDKKRVVFVNLHSDWMLVKTASVYVFKYSAAVKHRYLFKYLINNPEYEVCNYINDKGFSLIRSENEVISKFLNLFRFLENRKTMKVNGIDSQEITLLRKPSEILPTDIVILYNVCSDNYRRMSGINAFKALSMLHFHGRACENDIINEANISCLFGEVNLEKNCELYRRYYKIDKPWIVHPFVFAERFQNRVPFSERKNMAFATGTITYKLHEEFLDTYGDSCDQPTRKQIKDNPEFFKDMIYCTSSDYLEDSDVKTVGDNDIFLTKIYKKIYNRFFTGKQKKYYSFDMVEAFNSYKMCIVGEEILGIPGIGFVEGMACGCAYIGQDLPAYRDWGLIPGKHFITYDGTKEDLKRIIQYYQKEENQAELEQIANTGYEYVRKHFNGNAVAEQLMKDLIKQQKEWLSEKGEG